MLCGFAPTMEVRMRGGGLISAIVVVWLVIGVIAAFQRDYLKKIGRASCRERVSPYV